MVSVYDEDYGIIEIIQKSETFYLRSFSSWRTQKNLSYSMISGESM